MTLATSTHSQAARLMAPAFFAIDSSMRENCRYGVSSSPQDDESVMFPTTQSLVSTVAAGEVVEVPSLHRAVSEGGCSKGGVSSSSSRRRWTNNGPGMRHVRVYGRRRSSSFEGQDGQGGNEDDNISVLSCLTDFGSHASTAHPCPSSFPSPHGILRRKSWSDRSIEQHCNAYGDDDDAASEITSLSVAPRRVSIGVRGARMLTTDKVIDAEKGPKENNKKEGRGRGAIKSLTHSLRSRSPVLRSKKNLSDDMSVCSSVAPSVKSVSSAKYVSIPSSGEHKRSRSRSPLRLAADAFKKASSSSSSSSSLAKMRSRSVGSSSISLKSRHAPSKCANDALLGVVRDDSAVNLSTTTASMSFDHSDNDDDDNDDDEEVRFYRYFDCNREYDSDDYEDDDDSVSMYSVDSAESHSEVASFVTSASVRSAPGALLSSSTRDCKRSMSLVTPSPLRSTSSLRDVCVVGKYPLSMSRLPTLVREKAGDEIDDEKRKQEDEHDDDDEEESAFEYTENYAVLPFPSVEKSSSKANLLKKASKSLRRSRSYTRVTDNMGESEPVSSVGVPSGGGSKELKSDIVDTLLRIEKRIAKSSSFSISASARKLGIKSSKFVPTADDDSTTSTMYTAEMESNASASSDIVATLCPIPTGLDGRMSSTQVLTALRAGSGAADAVRRLREFQSGHVAQTSTPAPSTNELVVIPSKLSYTYIDGIPVPDYAAYVECSVGALRKSIGVSDSDYYESVRNGLFSFAH